MAKKTYTVEEQAEMKALKDRATLVGIKFHPNIGLDKLRDKVNTTLASEPQPRIEPEAEEAPPLNLNLKSEGIVAVPRENAVQRNMRLRKKATRLVRYRLTCMNPDKKEWKGEFITVLNRAIGTVKRYIPFNAPAWHCEDVLLNVLRGRNFTKHYATKSKSGRPVTRQSQEKEFAIEMLEPLTQTQLDELAQEQAISGRLEDE